MGHEHDPLALHQALQSAVDDGQNPGMDENVGFMSELPIIKSEWSKYFLCYDLFCYPFVWRIFSLTHPYQNPFYML